MHLLNRNHRDRRERDTRRTSSTFDGKIFGDVRKRTPSGRSSTINSAPAVQPRLSRIAFGRMTCPLVETLVFRLEDLAICSLAVLR